MDARPICAVPARRRSEFIGGQSVVQSHQAISARRAGRRVERRGGHAALRLAGCLRPFWKQQDPQLPKSIWYMTDAQWLGFRLVRPAKPPGFAEMYLYWNSGLEHDEQ